MLILSTRLDYSLFSAGVTLPTDYAYWKFDETTGSVFADSSGNGNTGSEVGTLTMGATAVATDGGNAVAGFTTDTNYITVPHSSSIDIVGEFAVSFWIKSTESSIDATVYDKRHTSSPGQGITFGIQNGSGTPNKLSFNIKDTSATTTHLDSATTVNDGSAHLVIVNVTTSTFTIYVDDMDTADASTPTTCNLANISNSIDAAIGNSNRVSSWDGFENGTIDNLRFFDTPLTQAQRNYILDNGL